MRISGAMEFGAPSEGLLPEGGLHKFLFFLDGTGTVAWCSGGFKEKAKANLSSFGGGEGVI